MDHEQAIHTFRAHQGERGGLVVAAAGILVLGTMSTILHWGTSAPLSDPGEPAGFAGAVIQFLGLTAALGAGIVAAMHAQQVRT